MNAKKRLLEYLKHKDIGQTRFEQRCGISTGYISNNKGSIGTDILIKIINTDEFSDLDLNWLVSGSGSMLKNIELNTVFNGKAIEVMKENQNVPLYNIEAAANLSTIFVNDTENIDGYISLPKAPSVDGAIPIRGDSMYPLLKSGDYVIYKKVSSPDYLIFGQMYIVEYEWDGDTQLVVKYVQRAERENFVKLVSYNIHHEPMDIPIGSIRNLALVKISVRYNTIK